jgi:hypothetical protein
MNILPFLFDHWHEIAYVVLFLIAIGNYVLHFLDHKSKLSTESLLMLVLFFVVVIATRMEGFRGDQSTKMDELSAQIRNMESPSGFARVEKIANADQMFSALIESLNKAQTQIHVTSIRNEPPALLDKQSGLASEWYSQLRQWPNKKPGRVLYRLIGVPNKAMNQWFHDECTKRSRDNYTLASVDWDGKSPTINIVVFDHQESYLIFSPPNGPLAETEVYRVTDPSFADLLIRGYFEYLNRTSSPCSDQ